MSAKRATVVLALTAALALWSPPAHARVPHGGGRPGGARAVPRGGGAPGRPGGGVAAIRHPRAGTGGYGYASRAYRGYGGYYRPNYRYAPYRYYGGYYRPYYRPYYGGYFGYYGPYASLSFGFGWPYSYGAWPYGWASYPTVVVDSSPTYGYGAPPTYGYGAPPEPPPPDTASDRDAGRVRLEVRPDDASVYVDDAFRGTAAEARFLTLPPGRHVIELVRPGFALVRRTVDVVSGETSDVLVELHRP